MNLAVSHDVLGKRLGVLSGISIMPHDFEIPFGIAVHDVANQDHGITLQKIRGDGYCDDDFTIRFAIRKKSLQKGK